MNGKNSKPSKKTSQPAKPNQRELLETISNTMITINAAIQAIKAVNLLAFVLEYNETQNEAMKASLKPFLASLGVTFNDAGQATIPGYEPPAAEVAAGDPPEVSGDTPVRDNFNPLEWLDTVPTTTGAAIDETTAQIVAAAMAATPGGTAIVVPPPAAEAAVGDPPEVSGDTPAGDEFDALKWLDSLSSNDSTNTPAGTPPEAAGDPPAGASIDVTTAKIVKAALDGSPNGATAIVATPPADEPAKTEAVAETPAASNPPEAAAAVSTEIEDLAVAAAAVVLAGE